MGFDPEILGSNSSAVVRSFGLYQLGKKQVTSFPREQWNILFRLVQ